MKLAVTPFTVSSIQPLSESGADIFILGNDKYANRLVKSFTEEEITEAVSIIKSLNKFVYIETNMIVHNEHLQDMENFIVFCRDLHVDGIIFGDLGIYNLAKRNECEHLLIYNPETLNTNLYDPIFWDKKGIKGITISKEITLEDIQGISANSTIEISLIGHGHLNMFHSRRPLIENYFKYNKKEYDKYLENRQLRLIEEIRDESYPVFQDNHGTHIFRHKALESYQEIDALSKALDVFIIDGVLKNTQYLIETVKNYSTLLHNFSIELAQKISKQYESDHDSGFLYKKTVYDKY